MSPSLPPVMAARHHILNTLYERMRKDKGLAKQIFDFNHTEHADLDLSWIDTSYQKSLCSPSEYQIMIATVRAHQSSRPHYHELGASSFIVLGAEAGFRDPPYLFYQTGNLEFPRMQAADVRSERCTPGMERDIPPYLVHRFSNDGGLDSSLLIVTHPLIEIIEGKEDIHFVDQGAQTNFAVQLIRYQHL